MTSTVILVPTLGRPHLIAPLVESIRAANTPTCSANVLFLTSPGDRDVVREIAATGCPALEVPWHPVGDYARKINAGYRATSEPLLFLGAQDLRFHPGWLDAAQRMMQLPDVGVVGTNDLGSPRVIAGQHSTHSLVSRRYADEQGTVDGPGTVLYEGYVHEFCDDELVGTAMHRHAWAFAADSKVEHLHPDWGKGQVDDMYAAQRQRMRRSVGLYQRRRRRWTSM